MATERQGLTDTLRGQWVLTDPKLRLISVGKSLYHGQSARSYLDTIGRKHLLPLMCKAAATGAEITETHEVNAKRWDVAAVPVLGPSAVVHAVLGRYDHAGAAPDRRPEIGAWEWDVASLRTYWTPALFHVYGYPEPPAGRDHWEAPEWFSLLERGAYPQMRTVLARFHEAQESELLIHLFRIERMDNGAIQRLRLAGRTIRHPDGRPQCFRGVTARVDGCALDTDEQFVQQQFLDASLALLPSPTCVVDLEDERLYLHNMPWSQIGIDEPQTQRLSAAVHPEDIDYLRAFLSTAPLVPAERPAVTTARFAAHGAWQPVNVAALRISIRPHLTSKDLNQVMIRLERAS